MRLDLDSLAVQSFATTSTTIERTDTSDTGMGGPHSHCYICEYTGDTVPSCNGYQCGGGGGGGTRSDTFVDPVCGWA